MRTKKILGELTGHLAAFNERIAKLEASATPSASNSALENFAVAAVNSQAQTLGAVGNLIRDIAEAGASRAAAALGRRRAATARRDKRGRMIKNACRLCENQLLPDPTVAEIEAHVNHRHNAPGAVALEHRDGAIYAHIDEREVQTNAAGEQQVECPNCAKPEPKPDPDSLN